MTRLIRLNLLVGVVVASIWNAGATPLRAQEPAAKVAKTDSVSIKDIEKAAEELANAVHAAVKAATEDPAVKVAALKVAKNAVVAAQVAITQQAQTLEKVLDSLAREIAIATEKQQAKTRTP